MSDQTPDPVVVLCRDLLFGSKISAASKATGIPLKFVRDPAKLAETDHLKRMVVDLNQPGHLEAAADWKKRTAGHVTGFAGHVQTETLVNAKKFGIDSVMTNGAFSSQINAILRGA
jgi:hypothetical protein